MSDETSAAIADDTKLVAGIIRDAMSEGIRAAWGDTDDRTLLALLPGRAEAVRLGLQAGRAAASSDLDAIKREAAREALDAVAEHGRREQWQRTCAPDSARRPTPSEIVGFRDRYLANTYPAPVPPHVTVNGWRVTWDGERYNAISADGKSTSSYSDAVVACYRLAKSCDCDRDVVRVLALREGRGDADTK